MYMDSSMPQTKYPVLYLRVYQQHPEVENLVTSGAGYLLSRMIQDAVEGKKNVRMFGTLDLPDLRLTGDCRPAQMLGLTKTEFRAAMDMAWDLYHLQVYVGAKEAGDRMRIPEDINLLHMYGGDDILPVVDRAPVGRTLRYLLDQMMEWDAVNDPYNEYTGGEPEEDEELCSAKYLLDYWDAAQEAGWDLSKADVKWPKNLFSAHDRAVAARGVVRNAALMEHFRSRYQQLSKYSFGADGLMIVPAKSQHALNLEGAVLHHCVAGYGESHAIGKTAIFFIRRSDMPKVPYFTLELDEEKTKVLQNRGHYNCGRTPEVQAFEERWMRWVKAGCRRDKHGRPIEPGEKRKGNVA